ncbi:hypothetical protein [Aureivirga sp. CE67]|uniref:hypothetical protein n=1 Tax=Aureivirga sp. CE67 TaxID=1788983 RepID=UPI0018C8EEA1|nr:hypothetical protein [Aureivirga sp. CE67]
MKKFKLLLCIFLSIISFNGISQNQEDYKILLTEPYKGKEKINKSSGVQNLGSGKSFILFYTKKGYEFSIYEGSKYILSKNLKATKNEVLLGEAFLNRKYHLFTIQQKGKKNNIIMSHSFNVDTNELISEKIADIGERNKDLNSFNLSANNKYLAFISTKKNSNRDLEYRLEVLNIEKKELQSSSLLYSKGKKNKGWTTLYTPKINNQGEAYALVKKTFTKKERKKFNLKDGLTIYRVIDSKLQKLNIPFEEKYNESEFDIIDGKNEITLVSFTSHETQTANIAGYFSFIISKNDFTLKDQVFIEIPDKVLQEFYGEENLTAKQQKSKSKELTDYKFRESFKDSQGNKYIIAEKEIKKSMNGGFYTYWSDLIVLKVNTDNSIEWGDLIPKLDAKPIHKAFIKNDLLHIVIQIDGEIKATNDDIVFGMGFMKTEFVYILTYQKDGKIKYQKVATNKKRGKYNPYKGIFNDDKFSIKNTTSKKFQLLIIE